MIKKKLTKLLKVVTVMTMAFTAIFTGSIKDVHALASISGDRILEQAKNYGSWDYYTVGTCTGLVTRVLDDLGIADSVVGSMVGDMARYSPDQMYANAVASSEAKAIWSGNISEIGSASSILKNGDLVVQRASDVSPNTGFGHVGFIDMDSSGIYAYGANNASAGVGRLTFLKYTRGQDTGQVDGKNYITVFRLAEDVAPTYDYLKSTKSATETVKVQLEKTDVDSNKKLSDVTFDFYRDNVKFATVKTNSNGIAVATSAQVFTSESGWKEFCTNYGELSQSGRDKVAEEGAYTSEASARSAADQEAQESANASANQTHTFTAIETATKTKYWLNPDDTTTSSNKTGSGDVAMSLKNERVRGTATLTKVDKETNGIAQGDSSLDGAVYGLYARENILDPADGSAIYKAGTKINQVVTTADGSASTGNLHLGKYYWKEIKASTGYNLDTTEYDFELAYAGQNVAVVTANSTVKEQVIKGKIRIAKKDVDTNKVIQRAGAVFDIYFHNGTKVDTVTTDVTGYALSKSLPYGSYYFKEIHSPIKYLVDVTDKTVTTSITTEGQVVNNEFADKRVNATLNLVKEDKDTGARPQGDSTLVGAVYGLYAKEDIQDPSNDGTVLYKKDTLVNTITTEDMNKDDENSSEEYATGSLKNLYLGEYYWQEIEPSEGYELDTIKYPVTPSYKNEKTETVVVNALVKETVRTGSFELIKTITDGNNSTIMLNEKGAEFTVVMMADYEACDKDIAKTLEYAKAHRTEKEYAVLTTNKDGIAKSPKLAYAKYIVVQTKKGDNGQETDLLKPFGFEVSENGGITVVKGTDTNGNAMAMGEDGKMHYHINNRPFDAYVKIVKRDLETNKIVSLNNATFKIKMLDKDGNPVLNYDGKDESISQNEGIKTDGEGNISMKVGYTWYSTFTTNSDNRIVISNLGQYQEDSNADKGTVQLPVKLHSGYYRIDEIKAPKGYAIKTEPIDFHLTANEIHQFDKDGDPFIEFTVKNQPIKGQIKIKKVGELLTGITKDENKNIQFEYKTMGVSNMKVNIIADGDIIDPADGSIIYKDGTIIEEAVTDSQGDAISSRLPLGNYIVQETQAPNGFTLNEDSHKVSLRYEGQDVSLVFDDTTIENKRQKIETSITKKDKESETLVAGTIFGLYAKKDISIQCLDLASNVVVHAGDLIETGTTDVNGKYTFKADLPLSEYEIKEIKAPIGYSSSNEVISLDGTYQGQDVDMITLNEEFKNEITKVEISKTDITTDKELSGNYLTVYEKENRSNVIDTWVSTNKPHMMKGLEVGKTYVLHEISSAYGFAIADDIEFTIEDTGKVQKVKMENKIVKGRLGFDKTGKICLSTDTGQNEFGKVEAPVWEQSKLLGAEITIYAQEDVTLGNGVTYFHAGDEIERLVSDWDTAYSQKLPVGKYYYVESKAPIGYVKDEEKHFFEIKDNQKDELQEIISILPNERPKYELEFKKDLEINDIENSETYKDVIFGVYAREDIYDYKGNVVIEPDTMVMTSGITAEGKLAQDVNLPVGGYYIKELQTNEAYILDEKEYDFYIEQSNDKNVNVEFNKGKALYNELKDYKVLVNKVDSQTGKNVISKDFEFTRYADKACTQIIDKAVANTKDGNALFDDIHYGITYIKETKAPLGYRLSDEVVKVEVNNDGVFVNDKKYSADGNEIYSIVYLNSLLPSSAQRIKPVNTGDTTNVALGTFFVGLFMVSGFGIFGTLVIRVKRKKSKNKE